MILPKSLKKKSLLFAPLLGVALSQGLHAQSEETDAIEEEAPREVIRVTGSRIKQIDMESASSVTTFTRDDLDRSGYGTVADFLRNSIPSGSMISENQTLSQVSGASSFGGRDFSSAYTLVLLNGRRLPINAIAADFVDLNLIPMAAVERIEYLTDGASAIYGSDAIAGVLNIITRKSFDGVSVSTRLGQAERGDGTELSWQVVGGSTTGRSNFLIAADFFKREPVMAKDRPLINSTIAPDGTDNRSPSGLPGYIIYNNTIIPFEDCPEDRLDAANRCLFDVAPYYEAIPHSERQNIYTVFDYRLTDNIEFFGEARYSRSFTHLANGAAPGGVVLPVGTPHNPYDAPITVVRRYLDFGPRRSDNTNEAFSLVGGLRGDLGANHSWSLEVTSHRLRNLQVGAGGQINSPAAVDAFSKGILNPFIFNEFDSKEKIEAFEKINTTTFREGVSVLQTYTLAVDGMLPIDLPGGSIGYAAGAEFRKERFTDRSDNLSKEGRILGSAGSDGRGERENEALFVEASLPVLDSLNVTTAARYDNIDNKHDATTYKLALTYSPLDQLKFRASYGTGFKAAGMHSLFLGTSFGVNSAIDEKTCGSKTVPCEIFTISGGNKDLEPETSVFYNLGVILQPLDSLSLSTDYWNINIENKVSTMPLQEILNDPNRFGDLIFRDPEGRLNTDGAYVLRTLQNLNKEHSAGIEIKANHAISTAAGQFSTSLLLNKLLMSKAQTTAVDPLCDFSTNIKGFDGRLASRWDRGAFGTHINIRHYARRNSYTGGRISGSCERQNPDSKFEVSPHTEGDIYFTYQAPFQTTFGLGVNNVTDEKPAYDRNETWPWYSQERYSNMGRFFYVSATHEFR